MIFWFLTMNYLCYWLDEYRIWEQSIIYIFLAMEAPFSLSISWHYLHSQLLARAKQYPAVVLCLLDYEL